MTENYEDISPQEREAAANEFNALNRFLPATSKTGRRNGIDHDGFGHMERVTLKPGQQLDVRLLPSYADPDKYFLRLVQHVWPPFPSQLTIHTVCPKLSDYMLVDQPRRACEACAAGVDTELHAVVYALVNDRRRALGIKFTPQNMSVLSALLENFAFDFRTGRRILLSANERWHLSYELLDQEPLKEAEFEMALGMGTPHVTPINVRFDKLHDMAAALKGWETAKRPEPQPGQCKALTKLLPDCTLVPIPWGCKGPQELGWQNVGYMMLDDVGYRAKLDSGNIGLLCGLDFDAASKKLVPNRAVVGLDADAEDFADAVYRLNP